MLIRICEKKMIATGLSSRKIFPWRVPFLAKIELSCCCRSSERSLGTDQWIACPENNSKKSLYQKYPRWTKSSVYPAFMYIRNAQPRDRGLPTKTSQSSFYVHETVPILKSLNPRKVETTDTTVAMFRRRCNDAGPILYSFNWSEDPSATKISLCKTTRGWFATKQDRSQWYPRRVSVSGGRLVAKKES